MTMMHHDSQYLTADENPSTSSREKLLGLVEKMDREQVFCFTLIVYAARAKQESLIAVLTKYFEGIGLTHSVEVPEPDWTLLGRIRSCISDECERNAWAALFLFPTLRGDPDCLAIAETAAQIRVSN